MRARHEPLLGITPAGAMNAHVPERKRNPFTRSAAGGRTLSAMQLPWFTLLPPRGFGVLTTVGRRTGKTRRRCVRAIRRGDRVYIVSIGGPRAAWVKNLRANPRVRLRIRGGTFDGLARELTDPDERREAMAAYCGTINRLDYAECRLHRGGRPTRQRIEELHRKWFTTGLPLVVELGQG